MEYRRRLACRSNNPPWLWQGLGYQNFGGRKVPTPIRRVIHRGLTSDSGGTAPSSAIGLPASHSPHGFTPAGRRRFTRVAYPAWILTRRVNDRITALEEW